MTQLDELTRQAQNLNKLKQKTEELLIQFIERTDKDFPNTIILTDEEYVACCGRDPKRIGGDTMFEIAGSDRIKLISNYQYEVIKEARKYESHR